MKQVCHNQASDKLSARDCEQQYGPKISQDDSATACNMPQWDEMVVAHHQFICLLARIVKTKKQVPGLHSGQTC